MLWLVVFIATDPRGQLDIGHLGTVCPPGGPCLIPLAPGLMAPSGVLMIGLVLVLRDLVHRELGVKWAAGAIVTGAALSAFLAPPARVVASCAALWCRSSRTSRCTLRSTGAAWAVAHHTQSPWCPMEQETKEDRRRSWAPCAP